MSPPESAAEYLGFSPETVDILETIYGSETKAVVQALKTPGQTFSIRVNLYRITREAALQTLEEAGTAPSPHPTLKEVILLPVSGPYELSAKDGRELLVDKKTAEAVMRGANVYAPGITRCEKVRRGEKVLVTAPNHEHIATGEALMGETEILTNRKGLAVRVEQSKFKIPSIRGQWLYEEGYIYPQTIPSILVALNLQPNPDETIVDMNAAPGGKVSHLAILLKNKGRIFAFDRHAGKVTNLRRNLDRMQIECVVTRVSDSRYLDKDFPNLKADAVLVDPPCSALGLRPKIYDETTRSRVRVVADYQRQFLEAAARILKPEGRVLYSVCTMTLEECERQIIPICEKYGLSVEKQEFVLGSAGMSDFAEAAGCQRFHPHIHDTPGFFLALLKKTKQ